MRAIAIIGLGWLGAELGKQLKANGFFICGTTTSVKKSLELNKTFDQVVNYKLGDSIDQVTFKKAIDFFVITIPPSSSEFYVSHLEELIHKLKEKNKSAKFIYTSSISVYGSEPRIVNEGSETNAETSNAKKMLAVEKILQGKYSECSSVIRLGGLVGDERHPVNYLSGRIGVKKPNAAINLIHRDDVLSFISALIEHFQGITFNLVSPNHPKKKEYYNWVAEQKDLMLVVFDEEDKNLDKVVNCIAVKSINFEFKYRSPYDFPISN